MLIKVMAAVPLAGSSHSHTQEQAPLKSKCASSQVASQRSLAPYTRSPQESRSPVLFPTSPQDGTSQDMKAMAQDMIRSSLTQFGVIPQETPAQPRSHSSTVDTESPQIVDISEGEIFDSEQEGPDFGTPELDKLVHTAEEQLDYDSFALASPSVTRAPLGKFAKARGSTSD